MRMLFSGGGSHPDSSPTRLDEDEHDLENWEPAGHTAEYPSSSKVLGQT